MRGLRGVAAGVLTLIVLQVLSTSRGTEQGGKLLVWLSGGLRAALSPEVAAIPHVAKKPPGKKPASGGQDNVITLPRNPPTPTPQTPPGVWV